MSSYMCQETDLQTAVYRALVAADRARVALYNATSCGNCSTETLRAADRLEHRLSGNDIFSAGDAEDIRAFAKTLAGFVEAATKTEFIYDECCMSGGFEQSVVSEHGVALMTARRVLYELADALTDVRCRCDAERIASRLLR